VNEEEFRLLDEIEDTHWWFQGKRELLEVVAIACPGRPRDRA
jgi:hypothetical protein